MILPFNGTVSQYLVFSVDWRGTIKLIENAPDYPFALPREKIESTPFDKYKHLITPFDQTWEAILETIVNKQISKVVCKVAGKRRMSTILPTMDDSCIVHLCPIK